MRKGGMLTYLHTDQLGSTVLETKGVDVSADHRYFAYGRQRDAGPVVTNYRFTGQKEDGTGLVYMNARYYDPVLGQFISPDTIVPEATNVLDYNRYMYGRGNPLKYNDPSGHFADSEIPYLCSGCKSWEDVWAHFGIADDQTSRDFFDHELTTFGSIVFTGDGGEYTLVLGSSVDRYVNGEYVAGNVVYSLAVWDNINQSFSSIYDILQQSNIAVFGTDSRNIRSEYKPGFTKEWDTTKAKQHKVPKQKGIADLEKSIRPTSENLHYGVHRFWSPAGIADLATNIATIVGALVYGWSAAENAADTNSNMLISARWPSIEFGYSISSWTNPGFGWPYRSYDHVYSGPPAK